MVSEKIFDPDEERKREEEKKEALKEALRKEEERKREEEKKEALKEELRKEEEKRKLEDQINEMKGKINELRDKIRSANISDDLKQEPLKKLDEAYYSLDKAEENIGSNNIENAKGYIDYAQRSIDAASYWLSQNQNKEQSLGMGY